MQPLLPRTQLVEQVYDRLLEAICSQRFAPGARLAQEKLAELLDVSRQPVSHALQLLKRQGFVRDAGRRGLVVAPIEPDYLGAVYDVRAALDGLAASKAAQRVAAAATDDRSRLAALLAQGRALLERGRAAVAAADKPALVEADVAFHGIVNALAANPVLIEIARQQWAHIRRAMVAVLEDRRLHGRFWAEHTAILTAISGGEPERAGTLAREHAMRAGRETRARLAGRSDRADLDDRPPAAHRPSGEEP